MHTLEQCPTSTSPCLIQKLLYPLFWFWESTFEGPHAHSTQGTSKQILQACSISKTLVILGWSRSSNFFRSLATFSASSSTTEMILLAAIWLPDSLWVARWTVPKEPLPKTLSKSIAYLSLYDILVQSPGSSFSAETRKYQLESQCVLFPFGWREGPFLWFIHFWVCHLLHADVHNSVPQVAIPWTDYFFSKTSFCPCGLFRSRKNGWWFTTVWTTALQPWFYFWYWGVGFFRVLNTYRSKCLSSARIVLLYILSVPCIMFLLFCGKIEHKQRFCETVSFRTVPELRDRWYRQLNWALRDNGQRPDFACCWPGSWGTSRKEPRVCQKWHLSRNSRLPRHTYRQHVDVFPQPKSQPDL